VADPKFPETIDGSERRIILTNLGAWIAHLVDAGMAPEDVASVALTLATAARQALDKQGTGQ